MTLAGRAKPEEKAEEEGEKEEEGEGEEIIIVVEEDERKATPGVTVELKEEKAKEDLEEATSPSPYSSSSTVSPVWESRKLIGRGGWRQIGPSRASWRGHLEDEEKEENEEEGGKSRSSEARGRSLELAKFSLHTQETEVEEEEVVVKKKQQGIVALGRAEGRVAGLRRGENERREGRMVVERANGVDLLQFTNFLIVTVGVAVFIILSSGKTYASNIFNDCCLQLSACGNSGLPT